MHLQSQLGQTKVHFSNYSINVFIEKALTNQDII